MYTEDKILRGGEITAQGDFRHNGGQPFYLFLAPKHDEAKNIAILNTVLTYSREQVSFPFIAGVWNPVVLDAVSITAENLSNYRIFWGAEK